MIKTIPFREEHLQDAARLVSDRYQRLREQVIVQMHFSFPKD